MWLLVKHSLLVVT